MALTGELKKEGVEPNVKETFVVSFTNGAVNQLKELRIFLNKEGIEADDDLTKVVETAIGFLLRIKEDKEKGNVSSNQ